MLEDVISLREEEWRTNRARDILKEAYGENNERLKLVKVRCCFSGSQHRMVLGLKRSFTSDCILLWLAVPIMLIVCNILSLQLICSIEQIHNLDKASGGPNSKDDNY